jgi:hypothetical protein
MIQGLWEHSVAGSNPVAPIQFQQGFSGFPGAFFWCGHKTGSKSLLSLAVHEWQAVTCVACFAISVPVEIGTTSFPTPEPDYEFQPACMPLTTGTASSPPPRGGYLLLGTDGLLEVRVFNGSTPSRLSIGLGDVLGRSDVRGGITGPPTCVSTTDPASNAHSGGRMDCFFRNGRYYLERITLSFNRKGTLVNFPRVELWSKACTGCPGTIRYSW